MKVLLLSFTFLLGMSFANASDKIYLGYDTALKLVETCAGVKSAAANIVEGAGPISNGIDQEISCWTKKAKKLGFTVCEQGTSDLSQCSPNNCIATADMQAAVLQYCSKPDDPIGACYVSSFGLTRCHYIHQQTCEDMEQNKNITTAFYGGICGPL
jgi:hypothetical protein